MKLFRKVKATDKDLALVQDNIYQILQPLSKNPLIDGVIVSVSTTAGTNRLNHTLGRLPLGWFVVDTTSAETLYRTDWDSKTISLTSSGTADFLLYVY